MSTAPFSSLSSASSKFKECLSAFTLNILTLPILPNRLPIPVVTQLSAKLPFAALVELSVDDIVSHLFEYQVLRVHLIANLLAFGPPRIPNASSPTLNMYLSFLIALMDSLPPGCFDSPAGSVSAGNHVVTTPSWLDDSSDSGNEYHPTIRAASSAGVHSLQLDSKTMMRLQTLYSSTHLSVLMQATQRHPKVRERIFGFFMSLWLVWPNKKDKVLATLHSGAGSSGAPINGIFLMKEVWRGWVRSSAVGKEEDPKQAIQMLTGIFFLAFFVPSTFMVLLQPHLFYHNGPHFSS